MTIGDGGQARQFLRALYQSDRNEQLVTEARRVLGQSPEDLSAHYFLCLGLVNLEQFREARHHLDFLLSQDPESTDSQYAAASYYGSSGKWGKARPHIAAGLRMDPDETAFLTWAAIADLNEMKLESARWHIDRARHLEPENPEIVNLHIRIHAATEESATAALRRLEEYQSALRLDPENASLHNSIGDVYLNELESPLEAEKHYRVALQAEPGNAQYQSDLFDAVAKRSLIYRLFSIPSRTFKWLRALAKVCRHQPWRILLFLIAGKLVLCFFGWLILATVVFWPGGKVYEWLLVSEMKSPSKVGLRGTQWWYRLRALPIWSRFLGFLIINLALWGALFSAMKVSLVGGYKFFGFFVAFHFVVVLVLWMWRKMRTAASRRRRKGKQPPPLPKPSA